jgi:chromosome segregation protein
MQLKKIRLGGFKSFVDPTTFVFPSRVVGVVGPNGCGKSNVIDAVRWVLGENSARHLRGDALSDVIFNGSSSRKPVGQATVELVFDNSAGRLGGQYAQYSEIAIKRQLSRDGQSTYFLNGTRCRRRDITDVFLGTGLGPRSYAIIEQGTVSRLIEAKPEELRTFLEEAAGISKYKERRRETENRIRDTRENLNRLNDVVSELEKRLQTLQRQAKAAERYRELKQEERLVRGQLLALRCRTLDAELAEKDRAIASQETDVERGLAELRSIEAAIERLREAQAESNAEFNAIQAEFYNVGAAISRTEQSIQHARDRQHQQRHELEEIKKARAEAVRLKEEDSSQISELSALLAAIEPEHRKQIESEAASAAALLAAERSMMEWQTGWDEFNRAAAEQGRRIEVERTRIQHLEERVRDLRRRLDLLEAEERGLAAETDQALNASLESQVEAVAAELEVSRRALQDLTARMADQRAVRARLLEELEVARLRLGDLERNQASLEAMQNMALGKADSSVARWLESQGWHEPQRLAERLEVEPGWEAAVEAVLGAGLQAICVDSLGEVASRLDTFGDGSLMAYDVNAIVRSSSGGAMGPLLSEKVRAPWPLESLLGGVYIADSIEQALALRDRLQPHESVVTRGGVWIGPDWLRIVHDTSAETGVIQREQALREGAHALEAARRSVAGIEKRLGEADAELRSLEHSRDEYQRLLDAMNIRRGELQAELSRKNASLEQIRRRRERLREEISEVSAQIARDERDLATAREHLDVLASGVSGHEARHRELLQRRDDLRDTLERCRAQAQADRQALHETTVRIESARSRLQVLSGALERVERQIAQLDRQHQETEAATAAGEQPIVELGRSLEQLLERRLEVEYRLGEARRRVEETDHEVRDHESRRNAVEQAVLERRAALEHTRLARQELVTRREGLLEQLATLSQSIESLLGELPADANDIAWQQRLLEIEQKIERMGAINLAAIDEFAEISERKGYLDKQLADLNEALASLERAIRKIDSETRTRFKETFDQVNEQLGNLFPKLFGGGQARLEMTTDDLLEAGVIVTARPPGKRNVNIHQLSGGEKALTAISLVFALFELNPAPFCMLDEVDAPLDDNNNIRFCELVKEMSDRVQFIVITHNKLSMEMADQLIGVTMQEPGVSRLVAVDVEESLGMAG